MTLIDGLDLYQSDAGPIWIAMTLDIERRAQEMVGDIQAEGPDPNETTKAHLHRCAYELLIDIEKWKGMCMRERMVNAAQNSPALVWAAFYGAVTAKTDIERIRAIMCLKGFGSSVDEDSKMRRAKVASSVLRFFYPNEWGVVDWRTLAMRSALRTSQGNVDEALKIASKKQGADMRKCFDLIDENAVCDEVREYRQMRGGAPLSRAADIDMALFGLSVKAWPFSKNQAN